MFFSKESRQQSMVTTLVAGTFGILAAWGGYRIFNFVQSIRMYREKTKSEWISVPSSFLATLNDRSGKSDDTLRFFRINDEVMGGKSTSELSTGAGKDEPSLVFAGVINTNGGGFASCRTLGDDTPLGLAKGHDNALLVDLSGDDQLYKVMLYTADSWSMGTPSWSHDVVAGKERTTHRLALSDFVAGKQGRPVKDAVLDGAKVTGIGFSLSLYAGDGKPNPKFGDGPFRLEVHSVKEVSNAVAATTGAQ